MLHAAFLRSPFAHARIKRIDSTQRAHYLGSDIGPVGREGLSPGVVASMRLEIVTTAQPILAAEVSIVGESVAIVVAQSARGRGCLQLIDVEYEELTPYFSDQALKGDLATRPCRNLIYKSSRVTPTSRRFRGRGSGGRRCVPQQRSRRAHGDPRCVAHYDWATEQLIFGLQRKCQACPDHARILLAFRNRCEVRTPNVGADSARRHMCIPRNCRCLLSKRPAGLSWIEDVRRICSARPTPNTSQCKRLAVQRMEFLAIERS